MRLLLTLSLCFAWASTQAQIVDSKLGLQTVYLPDFTVQEASNRHIQAYGLRWMFSDYDLLPLEFGFNAQTGYGEVSQISIGFDLAYLLTEVSDHDFKVGLGLRKIDLKNVETNKNELGPHIGDVSFTGWGNNFKPYLEWEWTFSNYSSLFVQTGYHIINGEKSVVTAVEPTGDPIVEYRVSDRDYSFFYSTSGLVIGVGISVNF